MEKRFFSDIKENIIWTMVIFSCILGVLKSEAYIHLLLFWSISFVCVNNVKRFLNLKSLVLIFIRRNIYILPLLAPLLFIKIDIGRFKFLNLILGVGFGIIFILPTLENWKLFLESEYILIFPKKKLNLYLMEIYSSFAGAISEELFYRGFLISILKDEGLICIFISAFMFFLHHYRCKWSGGFSKSDFINQFTFGLISAIIYYSTGNIFISIFMHLTFNSMDIILNLKKIFLFYVREIEEVSTEVV